MVIWQKGESQKGCCKKTRHAKFSEKRHFSPPHTFLKFFIKDFFSKYDQIRWRLQFWSHLLKKCLMELRNVILSVVCQSYFSNCNQIICLLNETFLTTLTTFGCVCNCCCVGKWRKIWLTNIYFKVSRIWGRGGVEDDHELYSSTEGVNFISSGTIVEGFHHHKLPSRRKQDLDLRSIWDENCWMKLWSSDD